MGNSSSVFQWTCVDCRHLNPTEIQDCAQCKNIYQCLKKSKHGEIKDLGTFFSIVYPKITNDIPDEEVKEGEQLALNVLYDSYPEPDVFWFHNEHYIGNSNTRIKQITSDKNATTLRFSDITRNDGGTYMVGLDNGYGICSASIGVKVKGRPGPPIDLKDKIVARDSITLSWDPPLDNGGYAVTKYIIEKTGLAKTSWTMVDDTDEMEYTVTKLLEGKKYYFRVAGISEMGVGEYVETIHPVVAKNPFSRPGKMNPPTITNVWKNCCTISWQPPENLGGSPILAYTVKKSEGETDKWMTIKSLREQNIALTFEDTRLTEGNEYYYRVYCDNKTGLGPISESSEKVKAVDPLIKPRFTDEDMKSTIVIKGGTSMNLSIPFISNPQPNIIWFYNNKSISPDEKIQIESKQNFTCLKLNEVLRQNSGVYKVYLENEYGKCDFEVDVAVLDPPGIIEAPPVISDITQGSCVIKWKPPVEDGGTPLQGYFILRTEKGSSRLRKINGYPIGTTNFVDSNLTSDKEYKYKTCGVNKMGTGPTSPFSEVIIAEGLPTKKSSIRRDISQLQWPSLPHIKLTRQSSMSVEDVRCREERRAIEKLWSIRKMCNAKNVKFTDMSFPAEAKSIYYDPNCPKKAEQDAIWLRPSDIKYRKDDNKLSWDVFRNPTPSDIVQGQLGDCWLLSCLAVIADRKDIIEKVLTAREYCPEGVYIATLCKDGAWTTVIIDDLIPCIKKGFILYTRARRRQLWVPLLEKAFAKAYGCYEAIVAGTILEGLTTLTGAPCEILDLNVTKSEDIDEVWQEMIDARKKKFLMGGSCGGFKVEKDVFMKMGLIFNHAYSILDVQEANGVRLVQLRNPWGSFSWKGDYSDKSQLWDKISEENKSKLKPTKNEEGIFWMPLYELIRYYEWVDMCKYRPDWMETRVSGTFSGNITRNVRISVIEVFEPTEVDFGLFQESNRAQSKESRTCLDLFIAVFEGDYHETKQLGSVICQSKREIEKSIGFPTMLDSGTYTVVCMAFNNLGRKEMFDPVKYMLVIHSSKCIVRDTYKMPAEVIADSLIQLALEKGRVRDTFASKGTAIYYLSQGWLGAIIIAENKNPTEYMHVTCDSSKSMNVVSTRASLKVTDLVPPMHRQVLMVLTPPDKSKFGSGMNFTQKTQESGELEGESSGTMHSPAVPEGLEPLYSPRPITD